MPLTEWMAAQITWNLATSWATTQQVSTKVIRKEAIWTTPHTFSALYCIDLAPLITVDLGQKVCQAVYII